MRTAAAASLVLLLAAAPACADPVCSKLSWPLATERAAMLATQTVVPSGTAMTVFPADAFRLTLRPSAQSALPQTPAKGLDPGKFAGFVALAAPAPGDYLISLSGEGWIDVFQGGVSLTSTAHTGDPDCPGLRKSVRFTLTAAPVIVQISNAPGDRIVIDVTRAP